MTRYSLKDMDKNDNLKPLLDYVKDKEDSQESTSISLKSIDIFLTCTLFCFLVVSCWRGTWTLLDIYSQYFPIYESFFLSIFIYTVFASSQTLFHEIIIEKPVQNVLIKCLFWACKKTYLFIFYLSTIMHWRSSWVIFDELLKIINIYGKNLELWHTDKSLTSALCLTLFFCIILMWIRGVNNISTTPMGINTDFKEDTFLFDYKFFKIGERTSLYVLDCIFSILIVGTLVVFVWRGVWLLVDIFLFPDDEILSYWSSLVLGYLMVAVAFLLQPLMRYFCERLTGAARLLLADLFILFALFGTVNVWRGIWSLLNIYFLPENLELSCWITHWVSLIILILCRCSNSLLVRGVYIDAEEPGGKCVVFPCYYLRVILRKKKLKKLNLTSFSLNDAIKANHKENEIPSNNHVVNISTICNTVEENSDIKESKK